MNYGFYLVICIVVLMAILALNNMLSTAVLLIIMSGVGILAATYCRRNGNFRSTGSKKDAAGYNQHAVGGHISGGADPPEFTDKTLPINIQWYDDYKRWTNIPIPAAIFRTINQYLNNTKPEYLNIINNHNTNNNDTSVQMFRYIKDLDRINTEIIEKCARKDIVITPRVMAHLYIYDDDEVKRHNEDEDRGYLKDKKLPSKVDERKCREMYDIQNTLHISVRNALFQLFNTLHDTNPVVRFLRKVPCTMSDYQWIFDAVIGTPDNIMPRSAGDLSQYTDVMSVAIYRHFDIYLKYMAHTGQYINRQTYQLACEFLDPEYFDYSIGAVRSDIRPDTAVTVNNFYDNTDQNIMPILNKLQETMEHLSLL